MLRMPDSSWLVVIAAIAVWIIIVAVYARRVWVTIRDQRFPFQRTRWFGAPDPEVVASRSQEPRAYWGYLIYNALMLAVMLALPVWAILGRKCGLLEVCIKNSN